MPSNQSKNLVLQARVRICKAAWVWELGRESQTPASGEVKRVTEVTVSSSLQEIANRSLKLSLPMYAPTCSDREFPLVCGFSTFGGGRPDILARLLCVKWSHEAAYPQQFLCRGLSYVALSRSRLGKAGGRTATGPPGTVVSYILMFPFSGGGGGEGRTGNKDIRLSKSVPQPQALSAD